MEDNAEVRELTKCLLGGMQAQFIECADGRQAADVFREHQPDWVLMDIQMPGMDGLAATRSIRRDFPEARVVIVTQFDGPLLRAAAREAGAKAYILKENLLEARALIEAETRSEHPESR